MFSVTFRDFVGIVVFRVADTCVCVGLCSRLWVCGNCGV